MEKLHIYVERDHKDHTKFLASFRENNLSAHGNSEEEAIENLKEVYFLEVK